ncbi:hypothetical protein [Metabacillus endolithicus]
MFYYNNERIKAKLTGMVPQWNTVFMPVN